MGREQRKSKRLRKRLRVLYGVSDLDTRGLCLDVSTGGMFVTAHRLLPIGAHVHMLVQWGERKSFYIEGEVVRHKKVPAAFRSAEPQGMGVRFLMPAEVVAPLITSTSAPEPTHDAEAAAPPPCESSPPPPPAHPPAGPWDLPPAEGEITHAVVDCTTAAALEKVLTEQVERGVFAVATGNLSTAAGARIHVDVRLAFTKKTKFVGSSGRVVQLLAGPADSKVTIVQLDDPKEFAKELRDAMRNEIPIPWK